VLEGGSGGGGREGEKVILQRVSARAMEGEVMGVMGPSGSGKTTLLSILSGSLESIGAGSRVTGEISLGGEKKRSAIRKVTAYVPQKDVLLPALTVEECIRYSALLRLPRSTTAAEVQERIAAVLKELGLSTVATSKVGGGSSRIRGVSGGERRRVSIGMELVTQPKLVIMDEPTSGLDSYTAYKLIHTAKDIAAAGRVVMMSLHQPSPDMFSELDTVLLMAKGYKVYCGAPEASLGYFSQLGMPCPPGRAAAEHMLHVVSEPASLQLLLQHAKDLDERVGGAEVWDNTTVNGSGSSSSITTNSSGGCGDDGSDDCKRDDDGSSSGGGRGSAAEAGRNGTNFWRLTAAAGGGGGAVGKPRKSDADVHMMISTSIGATAAAGGKDPSLSPRAAAAAGAGGGIPSAHMPPAAYSSKGALTKQQQLRRRAAAYGNELGVLFWRCFSDIRRSPGMLLLHLIVALAMGLLVGLIFYQLDDTNIGVQNRLGSMFFAVALFGFSSLTIVDSLVLERELLVRETRARYYGSTAYLAAKLVLDGLLLRTLPAVLFTALMYPLIGLVPEASRVVTFMFVLATYAATVGALAVALAAACRSTAATTLGMNLALLMWVLVGGYLVNPSSIPVWLRWVRYLSPMSYAFEAMASNEMADQLYAIKVEGFPSIGGIKGEVFLKTLGLQPGRSLENVAALVGFYYGSVLLAFVVTWVSLRRQGGGVGLRGWMRRGRKGCAKAL